jgi:hypothetical protein
MTKLTNEQVIEIRRSYPAESLGQLAKRFGVSRKTISVTVNRLSHKNVVDPDPVPPVPVAMPAPVVTKRATKRSMKHYGLYMRADQLAVLNAISEANGVPVSEFIRRAVDTWIGGTASARQPSTLAEEIEAHDSATWHGDPDAGIPIEGKVTVGKPTATGA